MNWKSTSIPARTVSRSFGVALAVACCVTTSAPAAVILRVDASATDPAPDGSTWPTAFPTLSAALDAAGPDTEIWVAAAALPYRPDTTGLPDPRSATFAVPSGVAIYGGFLGLAPGGNESFRDQRDPVTNVTTLSGDLAMNDGPLFSNISENVYHVVTFSMADATARLDGVRIVGGNAGGAHPDDCGGGILIAGGAPTVANCGIERCRASDLGAGVRVFGGAPRFEDSRFFENTGTLWGGGMMIDGAGAVTIERCAFVRNGNTPLVTVIDGPAITVMGDMDVTIRDCDFEENYGQCSGGALYAGLSSSIIHVARCRFIRNHIVADIARGGGIRNAATMDVIDTLFLENEAETNVGEPTFGGAFQNEGTATLINCVMIGNRAVGNGETIAAGAVDSTGTLTMTNCTVVANHAPLNGGILARGAASDLSVHNSIVWNNRSDVSADIADDQVAAIQGGLISADYSCIEAWVGGVGNTAADPMFVDAAGSDAVEGTGDDDLRLGSGSPCIDAARNDYLPTGVDGDARGLTRFLDDPATADTGVGSPPIVDMGAYEFYIVGDLDCDDALTIDDAPLLVQALLDPAAFAGCDLGRADVNADGATDGRDVTALIAALLM